MKIDPHQLLKNLEPAVRPSSAPMVDGAPRPPFEQRGFDEMLALVSRGTVHSGREITVAHDVHFDEPLDDEQRTRLAAAADRAEAAGAQTALMLIDGRGLVMRVPQRTITSDIRLGAAGMVIDVDAAVYVAGDEESERTPDPAAMLNALNAPGNDLSMQDAVPRRAG